jgi:hypothetical protein
MAWPSPEAAVLTLHTGESRLTLPVLPAGEIRGYPGFGPVEKATALRRTVYDPGREQRQVIFDAESGETVVRNSRDDGLARIDDIGTVIHYGKVKEFAIARNDPLTARCTVSTEMHYKRDGWDARLETRILMSCDKTHFIFHSDIDAYDGGRRFFSRSFDQRVPRDHR